MKKNILFISSFFIYGCCLFSQNWPKIYFPNYGTVPFSVASCYDKGFLIGGWVVSKDGVPINGLLIKTNINGEMLWYKILGEYNDGTGVQDVSQTSDNGFVISGGTMKTDPGPFCDPFIMKLNSCYETEWCRIYTGMPDSTDVGESVRQIPGGYIAFIARGGEMFHSDHIMLIRLDENGDLIWQQRYAQNDSLILGADGYNMIVTADNHYLISGDCYYPDSGTTGPRYLRPLIIKVDSTGNMEWKLPWRYVNGASFQGMSNRLILDNQNIIYSCGRHIEQGGDRPTMLKTDSDGNELSYYDMVPDSWQSYFFNINWFQDSTIALDGGYIMSPADKGQIGVFKVDKSGNILDSVNIRQSHYCFSDAIVDNDNKLFLVQGEANLLRWNSRAWKLNSNLDFDTLYTQPFVYDSLCPYPIPPGTIPLDCVIVGIDEPFKNPETCMLKVYPNPSSNILHIDIPEKMTTETSSPFFTLTTVYHQWKSALLEIYDLFGRRICSKEIYQSDKNLEIDVSGWEKGMYVIRLVYNKHTVANTKVVVN